MNAKPALIPNPNETGLLWLWTNEPERKTGPFRRFDLQSGVRAILIRLAVLIGVVSLVALIPHLNKAGPVPVITEPMVKQNLDVAIVPDAPAGQNR
ncbi:MAG: hypothetical protein RIR97_1483 [Pseudomonadota bacterium]|jgi:hypothetical protein